MKQKLTYIGNNKQSGNPTTMGVLTGILVTKGFAVKTYGRQANKIVRMIEMLLGILKNRKSDFLLIDTYSTWNFYYAFFGSQLARIFNLKYICILHGGDLPNRLKKSPLLSKAIFKNASKIIAPSSYLKVSFEKAGYAVEVIPNAIELIKYPYFEREFDTPKLLWVRAFQELYNPEMAIKVLELVRKKYPKATLTMVGPDKDGSLAICKEMIIEMNLKESVEFTGFLSKEEWIELSKECNVFISTSNFDNTPVSVVEAMALGLPVVSTNVGGMPYLIQDRINGRLVNPNDSLAMSQAVLELFNYKEKTKNLVLAARKKAEESDARIVGEMWYKLLQNAK